MKTKFLSVFILIILVFTFFVGSPYACYGQNPGSCPDNLLFLLKLNEASGPNYADEYGVNNAIATVSPTAATGKINGCQIFSESTFVKIPDAASDFEWAAGCSFSMEFWMKTAVFGTAQVGISRQVAGSGITWWLGINEYGGAVMEIKDSDGKNYAVYNKNLSVNYYADNQWHHFVGVKDGITNYIKLYADGVLVDQQSATFTGNFIAPSPTDVSVGYMLRADGQPYQYHLMGSLDEVAVYTRALTASEISSFYNNGAPVGHCSSTHTPEITSTPVTIATEDAAYSYTFTVSDEDAGDVLTLSAVNKPAWLSFNWTPGQKTATLIGTPGHANLGNSDVKLRVNDGYTNVDQSFTINVAAGGNDRPVITGQNPLAVNEDVSITLTKSNLTIVDTDNPPSDLTLEILAGSNYTFNGNQVTPIGNFEGQLFVNVIVKDLESQSEVYPVMITVNPVNDPPVITSNPQLTVRANSAYLYQVIVEDVDEGDVLTIAAPSKPNWLTLTVVSNSAILSGVPLDSDIGSFAIILTVNDGHVDVMQGFAIQVLGPSKIDDINSSISLVYPNPANDKIYFRLAETGTAKIEIYDMNGNLQKQVTVENEKECEVNITDLTRGSYIYKAYQNGKVGTGKFTKN